MTYRLPSERTSDDWAEIWARRGKPRRPYRRRAKAPAPAPAIMCPLLSPAQALAIAGRLPGAIEAVRVPGGAYCLDAYRHARSLTRRQRWRLAVAIQRAR